MHRLGTSGHCQTRQSGFWGAHERTVLSFLNVKSFGLRGAIGFWERQEETFWPIEPQGSEPVSIKMAPRAEHARYPTVGTGLGVPGPASGAILRLASLKAPTDCQGSQERGRTKNIKKSGFYREVMKPRANTQKEMCQSQK